MEWKYGNAWDLFPIKEGEIWGIPGRAMVAVHNLFEPLPAWVRPDLLFVDPPWNLGNVNSFYTKAGREDYLDTFSQFTDAFFGRVTEINPQTVYIEIGKQNVENYFDRLAELYPKLQRWSVLYYRKHPTWIIRGSKYDNIGFDFSGMDEADCISKIALIENYRTMGDICMGRGLVGLAAYKAGKPFVGTELNKRRLACLLQALSKIGAPIRKLEMSNE
jgi:hypothetical protein